MSAAPEREKISATPEARTARGAAVFAAIWLAIALASPLIVRYAPSTDDHAIAALVTRIEQPHCAAAPDNGVACQTWTLAARKSGSGLHSDL